MRIVSSQSDDDLTRANALQGLRWELRQLTANLMRIAAQAGKPQLVGDQCVAVLKTMNVLIEAGSGPHDWDLHGMLQFERDLSGMNLDADNKAWDRGLNLIVKGGIRVAAAELVGQSTQRSAGEDLIFEGLRPIEEIKFTSFRWGGKPASATFGRATGSTGGPSFRLFNLFGPMALAGFHGSATSMKRWSGCNLTYRNVVGSTSYMVRRTAVNRRLRPEASGPLSTQLPS